MDKTALIGSTGSYGNRFILTYHTTGKRIAPQQSRSTKIKSSLYEQSRNQALSGIKNFKLYCDVLMQGS